MPRKNGTFDWSLDGREDKLRELWAAQPYLTAQRIADLLGAPSRFSVIGKVNYMGLPTRDGGERKQITKRSRPKTGHPWHNAGDVKPPTPPRAFETPRAALESKPLLMRDFEGKVGGEQCECRWPLPGQADREGWMEETLFCGAPAGAGPYCETHHALSVNGAAMKKYRARQAERADHLRTQRRQGAVFGQGRRTVFQ